MTAPVAAPDVYTDFQGLARLRAQARADRGQALREVAGQFEALFVQMMLKSMRAASEPDPLFGSDGEQFYREILDQQLALNVAQGRGLGLAEVLVRQLGGEAGTQAEPGVPGSIRTAPPAAAAAQAPISAQVVPAAIAPAEAAASGAPAPVSFESPEDFVRTLYPMAQRAARRLGVAPEVLIAQAALETGWGRHIIEHPDGRSSHNLFGIKAGGGWDGDRVVVSTLEHEDGVAVRRREAFRAYGSFEESFQDYVTLLQSAPRYRNALFHRAHAGRFAQALQDAGYATDPRYAEKIRAILQGDALRDALVSLKGDGAGPLT